MSGSDGFEAFAAAETRRLLTLARVLTGNEHDAWDLTQETLVQVGLRWSRVDQSRNPHGYARTSLVRLNLNRLRKLRREWLTSSPDDHTSTRSSTGLPAGIDGMDAWLDDALQALPARQRAAVVLRHLEDLPLADIADALGCSTGSVKTHLSRGLAALRKAAPHLADKDLP